jgi:hypothetical protein
MHKHSLKMTLLSFLLGTTVLVSSGCVALLLGAAAGAGGIAYVKGTLEKNFDVPVEKVHRATLAAFKKIGVTLISEEKTQHSSELKGAFADEKEVKVSILSLTERTSKIQIRIGVFGDEDRSQIVLNAIQRRL